jgi:hypothetical protein
VNAPVQIPLFAEFARDTSVVEKRAKRRDKKRRRCKHCKRLLPARKRPHARTCSKRCRQARWRAASIKGRKPAHRRGRSDSDRLRANPRRRVLSSVARDRAGLREAMTQLL